MDVILLVFRLNVGNKVFLATWKMLAQHSDTKESNLGLNRPLVYHLAISFLLGRYPDIQRFKVPHKQSGAQLFLFTL